MKKNSTSRRNAEVIVFSSAKGGSAKTSTTTALSYSLAQFGHRVCAVDLDVNANLSRGPGGVDVLPGDSVGAVITDKERHLKEVTIRQAVPGVDLIPGYVHDTLRAKFYLQSELPRSVTRLNDLLEEIVDDYDFVLLDTPGELGVMLTAAVYASDWAIVPIPPKRDPIMDGSLTIDFIREISEMFNTTCEVLGLLPTLVDRRHAHATQAGMMLAERVAETKEVRLFKTVIPIESKFNEAELQHRPVGMIWPNAKTSQAYNELADEVCSRIRAARDMKVVGR
jgi:chromosome partitioning protein